MDDFVFLPDGAYGHNHSSHVCGSGRTAVSHQPPCSQLFGLERLPVMSSHTLTVTNHFQEKGGLVGGIHDASLIGSHSFVSVVGENKTVPELSCSSIGG